MDKSFILFVWATLIIVGIMVVPSLAQGPPLEHGMHSAPWMGECASLEKLRLSSDQREAVARIKGRYREKIIAYRQDLMIKRLALRDLFRNAQTSEAHIRQKSGELEEARHLLHNEMISYQLDIRKILTPGQVKRWCIMIQDPSSHGGWKQGAGSRRMRDKSDESESR